ncbi:MAG: hypothetical protein ACP5O7_08790 [Phycisphaerae bacterium]
MVAGAMPAGRCVNAAVTASVPSAAAATATVKAIDLSVNHRRVFDGQCVVVTAQAKNAAGAFAVGVRLRASVNGQAWCAPQRTSRAGVVHLLLPLPEVGANKINVAGGGAVSNSVLVTVQRRSFNIITDPDHLIGMEWEIWFGPGYSRWGREEAMPVLGHYSSLDPRVLRQQTLWFNKMGINFVEVDWTNNLTQPFPSPAAKECIAADKVLFNLYRHMRQHPKIVFLMGPEHNYWMNHTTPYTGPWYDAQLNYVYKHFIENPKYKGLYLQYRGKPLLNLYLNGPRSARPPKLHDPRFTIRYVGAWMQTTHENRYGVWSWYDQDPQPTYFHGNKQDGVEAMTVACGYPAVNAPGPGLNNWLAPDAGGKNYGQTYRTQWRAALRYRPRFLFLCQFNEFEHPDEYDNNLNNDMEPTLLSPPGSRRAGGWGFEYVNLTRREIARYHAACAPRANVKR